jgi:glycerol uptake facilitator protein
VEKQSKAKTIFFNVFIIVVVFFYWHLTCSKGKHLPSLAGDTCMDRTPTLLQKGLAEMFGTGVLVLIGPGSIPAALFLINGSNGKAVFTMADLGFIGLAFAIAIASMVYTIGHISGCHINPAITLAFAVTKRIPWNEAGVYIVAQFIGGILGALGIALIFGASAASTTGFGATNFSEAVTSYPQAIAIEALGTFLLLMVVMGTAVDGRAPAGWAGLMIGLIIGGLVIVMGPITGPSLNPARTFGPAIIQVLFGGSYNLTHLIVYFVGPIIGAILGVLTYDFLTRARAASASKEAQDLQEAGV